METGLHGPKLQTLTALVHAAPVLPAEAHYRPLTRVRFAVGRAVLALPLAAGVFALLSAAELIVGGGSLFAFGGVLLAALARRRYRWRRMVRALRDNEEAHAFLAQGQLDQARSIFERLCRRYRGTPTLHSLFVYGRAVSYLRGGQPTRARELLEAVLGAGWLEVGGLAGQQPSVMATLASTLAILGDNEGAVAWQRRAHDRVTVARRPTLLPMDVLIAARRGDHQGVLDTLRREGPGALDLLSASQRRIVRMLQAYALEHLSGAFRHEGHGEDLQDCLHAARPVHPGEYRELVVGWPELESFLVRHGLLDDV